MNDRLILPKLTNYGIIVHALHKSASMFLYKFFQDLSQRKKIEYFSANSKPSNRQELQPDIDTSFCLCPERTFNLENYTYKNMDGMIHIMQVRDPRDILVSQYFSSGWIHPDAKWNEQQKQIRGEVKSMSIDEYVLNASVELSSFGKKPLADRYEPMLQLTSLSNRTVLIVKYEDMVVNFKSWLSQVIKPFQFNPVLERILIERLFYKYKKEFKPRKEKLTHKRKMLPGDHREKLKPETIEKLNNIFQDVLIKFNYD
ncbi:MAG: sulfotransferase domain-containing protein [Microcystaceae cyanobacterium]